ncbi:arsenate reductase ArsC [Roseibacillus ishigakijimensis]|uniref:Arsenate reductase ArsC n=1 Tax=Roseibacillus ishigakijimensis TaxID=454146 RepID=A0A934VLX6_9BACT|nr:arsenate reductase ArsC [Roseibacillus ishigakijimensis]MBK1833360.1 arsenate reductase ArsC [Roseibacillus ishigakijimensis]
MNLPEKHRRHILILCTGNSCRSHMAEGFLRRELGDLAKVSSAGSHPSGYVHPLAIQVMKEAGVDISQHQSKKWDEFLENGVDTVITVCGDAAEACPLFPGQVHRHHWGFLDPAHAKGTEEEVLAVFRNVRDQVELVFSAYAEGLKESL